MAVFMKYRMEDNHMRRGTGLEGESAGKEMRGGGGEKKVWWY